MNKIKKIIPLIILLTPNLAQAAWFEFGYDQIAKLIAGTIFYINYLISYIGGIIFALGGVLLQMGLELNATVIYSPVVRTGWLITRDFANLGFVLAIIFIAFATILRLQNYQMKQMLTRLIIIALLVNFSLSIAGVLIDGTGVVSNFFVKQVAPNSLGSTHQFAITLASAFQVQKLQEITDSTKMPEFKGGADFSAAMIGLLASIFFVALFTFIGAVVMMTIAALVIVRYIAISFLLILMPLAWVLYIFPGLESNWKKWWNKFLQWLFFLPISLFFLYLAILMVTNFPNDPNSLLQVVSKIDGQNTGFWAAFLLVIKDTFRIFAQMIVMMGLMIGGLIAAKSFSLEMTGGVFKAAETAKNWAIGASGRAALLPGRWAAKTGAGRATTQWAADELTRTPGLRGAGSALSNYLAKGKDEVAKYQKKYLTNLSDKALEGWTEMGTMAKAAKAAEMAKRGKPISDVLTSAARRMGAGKEILKTSPHLAPDFEVDKTKSMIEAIERAVDKLTPKEATQLTKEAYENVVVAASFKKKQMEAIGKTNATEIRNTIEKAISGKIDDLKKQLDATNQQAVDKLRDSGIKLEPQSVKQLIDGTSLNNDDKKILAGLLINNNRTKLNAAWQ